MTDDHPFRDAPRGLTLDELKELFGPPTPEALERWNRLEPARRLGEQLRQRRLDLELTQVQVARRAGMRQPQIAALEAGSVNSTIETIDRVCRALGIEQWSLDLPA